MSIISTLFDAEGGVSFDQPPQPPSALQWIDLYRHEAFGRESLPDFLSELLHDKHIRDLTNSKHPPDYECTEQYELLIFRTVDQRSEIIEPQTRSTVFILLDSSIVSIRDEDDTTLVVLRQRWQERQLKRPKSVVSLLAALLEEIGNAYLALRAPLNERILQWQQRVLDPNDPFDDWQVLLQAKSNLRWLNINLELQRDMLQEWRDNTHYSFTPSQQIQLNDVDSHLGRIERLSEGIRADIDSLTSVYFATTGQKTNTVMQFLAVISAIFLPLNLIAGMFGMNFEHLPWLKLPWAPFAVVIVMLLLSAALLWLFKRWRWF